MAGTVALITGATAGIGKATAIGLATMAPGSASRVAT
jgi:NAD(P)-dependent dehydrogenase (short-subunit alcohol dehydrogenase family)